MNPNILITAATGKVGSHLVAQLARLGIAHRAGVHSPGKAQPIASPHTEIVPFDFDRPDTMAAALEGIETLVLITPADARQVDWAVRTIDLAKDAGVKRIIRMSVLAAAMEPGITLGRWHRTVERYLAGSGLDWTILRPGPFMQNFFGMYPASAEGFDLPVGDAAVTHIDVEDVASALAAVLTTPGHSQRTYMVTGAEALTMSEATAVLQDAAGRPMRYASPRMEDARGAFLTAGRPPWLVDILLELFAAFSTGAVALRTSTFRDLTGRDPKSFRQFAQEATARKAA